MSVFSVALEASKGWSELADRFEVPETAPAAAPLCCRCSTEIALDKSYLVDPTIDAANPCTYAVFKGLPPAGEFWRAVVEANCSAVVVLGHSSQHVETFFQSADPKQTSIELRDGRTVRCVHQASFPSEGLVVRQLEVAGRSGVGELWVNFLHLVSWPDLGVPSSTAGMTHLCSELESCRRPGARIAVQCCCGTDAALGSCPAGVLIAVDMLRQRLQSLQLLPPASVTPEQVHSALDVAALVRSLRAQRPGLVETADQWSFVHECVAAEIQKGLETERRLMPQGMVRAALARLRPAVAAAE